MDWIEGRDMDRYGWVITLEMEINKINYCIACWTLDW